LLIGLKVRTQARAIIGSLGVIIAWCIAPFVFVTIPMEIWLGHPGLVGRQVLNCSALLSPATIIGFNESVELGTLGSFPWLAVIVNFAGYGGMMLIFRRLSLAHADRWLGR